MKRLLVLLGGLLVAAAVLWWNRSLLSDWLGSPVELDSAKQQLVWDLEHATFQIETNVCNPWAAAWRDGDDAAWKGAFAADLQAEWLPLEGPVALQHAGFKETRVLPGADSSRTGNAEGLADFFASARTRFDEIDGLRLRILKIHNAAGQDEAADPDEFETRMLFVARGRDANGRWLEWIVEQKVELRFKNAAALAEVAPIRRWTVEKSIWRETPEPLFEEITEQAELNRAALPDNWKMDPRDVQPYQFHIAVDDYDLDGFLDIAAATFGGRPVLLHSQEGQRFENVAEPMGLKPWENGQGTYTALTAWIDFDNDGDPDLLMGDKLYRNDRGEGFADVTAESGLRFEREPMGCSVADYDADGLLDLYVVYQRPYGGKPQKYAWVGDEESGAVNHLWRNVGQGRFEYATDLAGAGGGLRSTFAATWLFDNDDHLPDLYVANDFGKNVLLRNRGDGTFEDVSEDSGASDYATSMGVASGDLDNDGRPEIYVANMYSKMGERIIAHVSQDDYPEGIYRQIQGSCAGNRLYRRGDAAKPYEDVSRSAGVYAVGWAYAPAMGDFNNDGWLDLYATTGFMSFRRSKPDG